MTITTKFDRENKVYFMKNNKINCGIIADLSISDTTTHYEGGVIYAIEGVRGQKFPNDTNTGYLDRVLITGNKVFSSKRELVENLMGDDIYEIFPELKKS